MGAPRAEHCTSGSLPSRYAAVLVKIQEFVSQEKSEGETAGQRPKGQAGQEVSRILPHDESRASESGALRISEQDSASMSTGMPLWESGSVCRTWGGPRLSSFAMVLLC